MPLSSISKVYPLVNKKALCAAMSQSWLYMSLFKGEPEVNPHIVTSASNMQALKDRGNLGGASIDALNRNHFFPRLLLDRKNRPFNECFHQMLTIPIAMRGFYVTIKFNGGAHAMAGFKTPYLYYFFEPDSGLYAVNMSYSGAESLAALMDKAGLGRNCKEFKLYGVVRNG